MRAEKILDAKTHMNPTMVKSHIVALKAAVFYSFITLGITSAQAAEISSPSVIQEKFPAIHAILENFNPIAELPAVPALQSGNLESVRPITNDPETIFWNQPFDCSPIAGCGGLFPVRETSQSQIGLLSDGQDSLSARIQTLLNAKRSVRIQALIFKSDESGRTIAEIIKRKKKAGLDVRIIVDAFSNPDLPTQLMYYDFKQNGIEVEGYEALFLQWINEVSLKDPKQPDKRFHDKMWIIDGEDPVNGIAIVGGLNIANEYFRTGSDAEHLWRDQDFILKGAIVSDVTAAFDRNYEDQKNIKRSRSELLNTDIAWELWRKRIVAKFGKINIPFEPNPVASANVRKIIQRASLPRLRLEPAKARFFQNRPRYGETFIRQAYERLFNFSRKELLVVNAYFIPEEGVRNALKNAARRGVSVTVITNSPETNDLPEMAYASRYLYQELLAVNKEPETRKNGGSFTIAEWNGHQYGEGTIHAKFAVADRTISLGGSYNLDARSELLNSETVIEYENERLSSELALRVLTQDLPKCKIITPEQAKKFHNPDKAPDKLKLLLWNGLKGEL